MNSIPALYLDPSARAFGKPRSAQWAEVRRKHLEDNPQCAACGRYTHLEVHHIEPFHVAPERELDKANLLTLCDYPGASCHLHLGHFGAWALWNQQASEWAEKYLSAKRFAQKRAHTEPTARAVLGASPSPASVAVVDFAPLWVDGSAREIVRAWLVVGVLIAGFMAFALALN